MNADGGNGILRADAADLERVAAAIVVAFADDPFVRWFLPRPDRFLTYCTRLALTHGKATLAAGGVFRREDHRGAAIWYPPGTHPDADAIGAIFREAIPPDRIDRVFEVFEQAGSLEPGEPHWYLRMIGVDPQLQGRGNGSALMQAGLEEIDRQGEPAYLEATSPASRDFYRRHGFETLGQIQPPGVPPVWPMLRPAEGRRRG